MKSKSPSGESSLMLYSEAGGAGAPIRSLTTTPWNTQGTLTLEV